MERIVADAAGQTGGRFAEELLARESVGVALTPNGDLQFVSEPIARQKLARLGQASAGLAEVA